MNNPTADLQGVVDSADLPVTSLLVSVGDAVELTQGDGGGGGEDKRYEYN